MIRTAMACLLAATLAASGVAAVAQQEAERGTGVVLRGLDKINGAVEDVRLVNGARVALGRLQIRLEECRFPAGSPATDAWAFLEIREAGREEAIFRGWMIASSPALNPLDHARYDVWVLRCTTS